MLIYLGAVLSSLWNWCLEGDKLKFNLGKPVLIRIKSHATYPTFTEYSQTIAGSECYMQYFLEIIFLTKLYQFSFIFSSVFGFKRPIISYWTLNLRLLCLINCVLYYKPSHNEQNALFPREWFFHDYMEIFRDYGHLLESRQLIKTYYIIIYLFACMLIYLLNFLSYWIFVPPIPPKATLSSLQSFNKNAI